MNNQFRILFISIANPSPPRAYAELPNITAYRMSGVNYKHIST